jgi:hypothetical protein
MSNSLTPRSDRSLTPFASPYHRLSKREATVDGGARAMARNGVSGDRKRLTVVLPDRSVRRLNALVEKTEASSYTEVLKNALRLYEALVDETEKGHEILVREGDGRLKSYQIFL